MSRIALRPGASGTGTFTITAPNSDTDRTLTLPDAAGAVVIDEAGGGSVKIDSSGNVGIGTSSPSRLLDVNGIAKASIFDAGGEGFIRGDAAGELRIQSGTTATTFRNNANNTEFMRIDSAGRVTMPYQPAFVARAGHDGTGGWISLTNGAYFYPSNYGSVPLNRGNCFNNGTGTFTAPVTGFYMFVFNTYTRGVIFGDHMYKVVNINGTDFAPSGHIMHYNDNGNADLGDSYSYTVYLTANDSIRMGVRPVSSNNDMQIYAGNTNLSGFLIG